MPKSDSTNWNNATLNSGANGYRLPTEAEWEYACRAGTSTAHSYGGNPLGNYMWYNGNSNDGIHAVGLKTKNGNDLFDMHGNVMEWCWDWYDDDYYKTIGGNIPYNTPVGDLPKWGTDPKGPANGTARVLRGGWYNSSPNNTRSACRASKPPHKEGLENGANDQGFRLVRSN